MVKLKHRSVGEQDRRGGFRRERRERVSE